MCYAFSVLALLSLFVSGFARNVATKLIFIKIPDPVMPIERGNKYEDPIDAKLKQARLGAVSGGGTQLSKDRQTILWVGVDVDVYDIDLALPTLKSILAGLNAPQGTVLECHYVERVVDVPLYEKK